MTDVERTLWRALREIGLPHKVRRQHPIGSYVTDFAIPSCKLVIELDGSQHADTADYDACRSDELEKHGYRVVRFWNNEVVENLEGVLQTIVSEVERSPTSP